MVSRRAKDFYKFLRSVDSFTDGQAKVADWDCDSMKWVVIDITPTDGPYRGAKINFKMELPTKFPREPPTISCSSNIYHPNIDPTSSNGNVCINLCDEWQENFGLEDCVQGMLFLLNYPNVEDPLSPFFSGDTFEDEEEFHANVRLSLMGRDIDGFQGERLIPDEEVNYVPKPSNDEEDPDESNEGDGAEEVGAASQETSEGATGGGTNETVSASDTNTGEQCGASSAAIESTGCSSAEDSEKSNPSPDCSTDEAVMVTVTAENTLSETLLVCKAAASAEVTPKDVFEIANPTEDKSDTTDSTGCNQCNIYNSDAIEIEFERGSVTEKINNLESHFNTVDITEATKCNPCPVSADSIDDVNECDIVLQDVIPTQNVNAECSNAQGETVPETFILASTSYMNDMDKSEVALVEFVSTEENSGVKSSKECQPEVGEGEVPSDGGGDDGEEKVAPADIVLTTESTTVANTTTELTTAGNTMIESTTVANTTTELTTAGNTTTESTTVANTTTELPTAGNTTAESTTVANTTELTTVGNTTIESTTVANTTTEFTTASNTTAESTTVANTTTELPTVVTTTMEEPTDNNIVVENNEASQGQQPEEPGPSEQTTTRDESYVTDRAVMLRLVEALMAREDEPDSDDENEDDEDEEGEENEEVEENEEAEPESEQTGPASVSESSASGGVARTDVTNSPVDDVTPSLGLISRQSSKVDRMQSAVEDDGGNTSCEGDAARVPKPAVPTLTSYLKDFLFFAVMYLCSSGQPFCTRLKYGRN